MAHKPEGLSGATKVDKGTLCRSASCPPGPRIFDAKARRKQKKSWAGSAIERVSVFGPTLPIAHIYFTTNSSALDSQDRTILDALCDDFTMVLDLGYQVDINIWGNADERGSPDDNFALGDRRAKAVELYMRERIPIKQKLSVGSKSSGEHPSDRSGLAEERRVDIDFRKVGETTFEPDVIRVDKVAQPVQFLFIELIPYNRHQKIHNIVIVEKSELVDKKHTFAYDERGSAPWRHKNGTLFFGHVVDVTRYTVKWREKKPSDTAKKILKGVLDYAVLHAGYDTKGSSSPDVGKGHASGRLGLYKSWDDYKARGSGEYLKYKDK